LENPLTKLSTIYSWTSWAVRNFGNISCSRIINTA